MSVAEIAPRLAQASKRMKHQGGGCSSLAMITAGGVGVVVSASLFITPGPLAFDMAMHVALMSVAAPVAALGLHAVVSTQQIHARWLWLATTLQLLLLWALHIPPVHQAMTQFPALLALGAGALLLASIGFWLCLLQRQSFAPWQDVLALLITAKLACLLAALLVFAPRALYVHAHEVAGGMADQQAAGLLMLVACPLAYLVPAIVLAARLVMPPAGDADTVSDHGLA